MSPDLRTIGPKLRKLLPLLSSDKDGEVVATARAIERTLRSEGFDLHDLAAVVEREPERTSPVHPDPQPYSYRPRPCRWERLRSDEKVVALDAIQGLQLSAWEEQFVASVGEMVRGTPHVTLTQKQVAALNRLLARVSGGDTW
jgi:hypothetical protein